MSALSQSPNHRARSALVGTFVVLTFLICVTTVHGRSDWHWYSNPAGCVAGKHIDPVGMVFLGKHADDAFVDDEVEARLHNTYGGEWNHGDLGQYFKADGGSCRPTTQAIANQGSPASRYHMRMTTAIEQSLDPVTPEEIEDPGFNGDPGDFMYWTLGTPHFDKKVVIPQSDPNAPPNILHCNPGNDSPKGSGFDRARRHIKRGIRDGGPKGFVAVKASSIGNTKKRYDACGSAAAGGQGQVVVSSNGWVVWVRVGGITKHPVAYIGPYTP